MCTSMCKCTQQTDKTEYIPGQYHKNVKLQIMCYTVLFIVKPKKKKDSN